MTASDNHFGYMVDLGGVEFSTNAQGAPTSWIQAMPLGTYTHPFFGEIEFTPERLKNFAASVRNNVRQTELDVDYDHKMNSGEAAGWVKEAEFRDNEGLFILVEWTKTAAAKIKEKAYKYFSPEFAESWKHPKTGATYKDVLFGGGITNRPFLKDILPLNLSELVVESGSTMVFNYGDKTYSYICSDGKGKFTEVVPNKPQPTHQGGGNKMTAKKFSQLSLGEVQGLAKTLGLSEEAPVGDVEKALNELVGKAAAAPGSQDGSPDDSSGSDTPVEPAQLKERLSAGRVDEKLLADISSLVADNPANKVLAEVIEAQQIELAQTSQALRFAEAQGKITKLGEVAIQGKRAFPAAVQEELRDIFIDAPKEFSDKVYGVLEKIAKTGMVQLGELGRAYRGDIGNAARVTLDERAKALMNQNQGMSYSDAVITVTRNDPRLFSDYRDDVINLD